MKQITFWTAIPLIALASCKNAEGNNVQSTDAVHLFFNLEKGKTYSYEIDAESVIKQEYNGQKMDMNMTIAGDMTFDVKDKNDNETSLQAHYNSLKFSMITPQGTLGFNSNNADSTDKFSKILSAVIGQPMDIKMAKNGSVTSVSGFDKIFKNMTIAMPDLTVDEKEQAQMQLEQMYGEEAIKNNFKQISSYLPNKPVKVGDTWTITDTMNQNGLSIINETTYKLEQIENSEATISGKNTIKPNPNFNSMANATYTGSGENSFKINRNTGWIISGTGKMQLKGVMKIDEVQGGSNAEMPIEMNFNTKYSGKQL